jgi:hypothetical protein
MDEATQPLSKNICSLCTARIRDAHLKLSVKEFVNS